MKILKRIGAVLVIIFLIIIYIANKDDKIFYVSIGDGISLGINNNGEEDIGYSDYVKDYLESINQLKYYTKEFSNSNYRVIDIINNIDDNIELDDSITIKKALMKSDIITMSIGFNEIMYKLNSSDEDYLIYNYIDGLMEDIDVLIDKIKKYCKEDIFVIGYYNPYSYDNSNYNIIKYANSKLINICNEEGIYYIDTYNMFNDGNVVIYKNNYPSYDGYKLISNSIIKIIKEKIIKNIGV